MPSAVLDMEESSSTCPETESESEEEETDGIGCLII